MASMQRITKDCLVPTYSPDNPIRLTVDSGEVFVLETHDRFASWQGSSSSPNLSDPALMGVTGAVAVHGVKAGDLLAVDILAIDLTSEFTQVNAIPGKGRFADHVKSFTTRRARAGSAGVEFAGLIVPPRPMVGRIGVAPAGSSVPSVSPGPHGGNIDAREVTIGNTIYLPVCVDGALLAAGDVHAAQGDGESMISGAEAMADLTLRCRLVGRSLAADLGIQEPIIRTPTHLVLLASASTLDQAAQAALNHLHDLIRRLLGLDPVEAGMLISLAADVGVAQLVNPLVTAKVSIPRTIIDLPDPS
jgi:amidase